MQCGVRIRFTTTPACLCLIPRSSAPRPIGKLEREKRKEGWYATRLPDPPPLSNFRRGVVRRVWGRDQTRLDLSATKVVSHACNTMWSQLFKLMKQWPQVMVGQTLSLSSLTMTLETSTWLGWFHAGTRYEFRVATICWHNNKLLSGFYVYTNCRQAEFNLVL